MESRGNILRLRLNPNKSRLTLASSVCVSADEHAADLLSGWSLDSESAVALQEPRTAEEKKKKKRVLLFLRLQDLIPEQPVQHLQLEGLARAFQATLLTKQSRRHGKMALFFLFLSVPTA